MDDERPEDPGEGAARRLDADEAAVLAVNQSFYDAFEARDLDAMSDVWEHSDRVVCTHPGWQSLRGWSEVSASWFALFDNAGTPQVFLTRPTVAVQGATAWVTVDENLLAERGSATVAALNVFVRSDAGWQMVAHHGSPVADRGP
jgi:ketosteroid isomerase-like protein